MKQKNTISIADLLLRLLVDQYGKDEDGEKI